MKKLLNFFSKRENTTEVKNTINTPKVVLESETIKESVPQPKRESKPWDGVKRPKYIYDSTELAESIMKSLVASYKEIFKREGYYIKRTENIYSEEKGFSANVTYDYYNTYKFYASDEKRVEKILNGHAISKERYAEILKNISKKNKKRINNLLYKLNMQPNNTYRFANLINTIENKTGNRNYYSILNSKEYQIYLKRKAYQDIVKHIKMDLPAELKKAKAELKAVKGDFYKTK